MVCFCLDTVLFNLFFLFSLVTAMTFLIKAAKLGNLLIKTNYSYFFTTIFAEYSWPATSVA